MSTQCNRLLRVVWKISLWRVAKSVDKSPINQKLDFDFKLVSQEPLKVTVQRALPKTYFRLFIKKKCLRRRIKQCVHENMSSYLLIIPTEKKRETAWNRQKNDYWPKRDKMAIKPHLLFTCLFSFVFSCIFVSYNLSSIVYNKASKYISYNVSEQIPLYVNELH